MPAKKAAQMFDVPAAADCKYCECGSVIYWIITAGKKRMPVDCDVPGGKKPERGATAEERKKFGINDDEMLPQNGRGVSHFVNCPRAAKFRKPR